MSERRTKTTHILLKFPGKTVKVELFPATSWPRRPGANPGRYRIRVDGEWLCQDGEKYSFLTLDAVSAWLNKTFKGHLEIEPKPDSPPPNLPKGSRVRVPTRVIEGVQFYELGFTSSMPFRAWDGAWKVFVVGRGEAVEVEGLGAGSIC